MWYLFIARSILQEELFSRLVKTQSNTITFILSIVVVLFFLSFRKQWEKSFQNILHTCFALLFLISLIFSLVLILNLKHDPIGPKQQHQSKKKKKNEWRRGICTRREWENKKKFIIICFRNWTLYIIMSLCFYIKVFYLFQHIISSSLYTELCVIITVWNSLHI